MRRMFQALAVCAIVIAVPASAQSGERLVDGLEEGLRNLDAAVAALGKTRPSAAKDRALKKLAVTRARLEEALYGLDEGRDGDRRHHGKPHDPPPPPVVQPLPAGPLPMDAGRFRDLVIQLKELSFSKDQQNYLRDAARYHYFLSEQVRQVVALFDFGKDKVDAAGILYPRTLDHENFYQVQKEMDFESDREALRKRIREIDHAGLPAGF